MHSTSVRSGYVWINLYLLKDLKPHHNSEQVSAATLCKRWDEQSCTKQNLKIQSHNNQIAYFLKVAVSTILQDNKHSAASPSICSLIMSGELLVQWEWMGVDQ